MLAVYAHNGHLQEAKTLFAEMPKKDGASWTCLLQAHCHAGTTHDSEEILQKMPFEKTIVHWTMLLDAHAKAGNLDRAREVYDQTPDPGAITRNAMFHTEDTCTRQMRCSSKLETRERFTVQDPRGDLQPNRERERHCWIEEDGERQRSPQARGREPDPDRWHHAQVSSGNTAHPSIKKVRKEVARLTKLMERDHGYKHENLGWSKCGGGVHSEKLAIAYALCEKSREISLVNNLRMCGDYHTSAKMISSVVKRKITVRDMQRLHGFENDVCSCADTWPYVRRVPPMLHRTITFVFLSLLTASRAFSANSGLRSAMQTLSVFSS
ncbi:pentatricopeptide repeat-containing protein At4g30700-like [Selaginella moellendorffii]|uniref:pentatricopeptide repeat-containing protein At4g30700-like n=1 Tax=Selaginella moellendorffii TaxID=88036 RepID=UPI000D1C23FC|nr:pentatricopeptide repeat-containing protein At4g30700-like [Selaginella moellendorffii]|eukprot:XP_024540208.1 pentatricopeptide repeat-containing protein At4g30700-like [Selaginella moellendorffii]